MTSTWPGRYCRLEPSVHALQSLGDAIEHVEDAISFPASRRTSSTPPSPSGAPASSPTTIPVPRAHRKPSTGETLFPFSFLPSDQDPSAVIRTFTRKGTSRSQPPITLQIKRPEISIWPNRYTPIGFSHMSCSG
jgi:hypothetical protein